MSALPSTGTDTGTTRFVSADSPVAQEALRTGEYLSSSDIELVVKTPDGQIFAVVYDPDAYPLLNARIEGASSRKEQEQKQGGGHSLPRPAGRISIPASLVSAGAGAGVFYLVYEGLRWLL